MVDEQKSTESGQDNHTDEECELCSVVPLDAVCDELAEGDEVYKAACQVAFDLFDGYEVIEKLKLLFGKDKVDKVINMVSDKLEEAFGSGNAEKT